LAVTISVTLVGAFGAALTVTGAAQCVGFGSHQRVDERGEQVPQDVGTSGGEPISQHSRPVDIVGSGHRVCSFFARVTLDGLSKNHAMTFNHSATTRRYR
jgi:hypothetical protein